MGTTFWAAALAEHSAYNQQLLAHDSRHLKPSSSSASTLSAFPSSSPSSSSPLSWSASSAASDAMSTFFAPSASSSSSLQARCVLVDMEEGVLRAIGRSSLSSLFSSSHCSVSDVSGAGNNFAQGFLVYGPQYRQRILDAVQRQVEDCDSLQSFFLSHSTGGGTGSGLGTAILDALRDEYADVWVVDQCILPSHSDDVVTSPYNAALSLEGITQQADVVLPFDNAALVRLLDGEATPPPTAAGRSQGNAKTARGVAGGGGRPSAAAASSTSAPPSQAALPPSEVVGGGFAALNSLCASVLCSLTCGMRFPGELNVDWSDLMQNMCPYPTTNLLISAMAPLSPAPQSLQSRAGGAAQVHVHPSAAAGRPPSQSRTSAASSSPLPCESAYFFHTLSEALRLHSSASSPWSAPSTVHFPSSRRDGLSPSYRSTTAMEEALFASALSRRQQLLDVDPLSGCYLSSALLCRGSLSLGSLQRAVAVWSPQMRFAALGDESGGGRSHWKLGLCSVPSLSSPASVLSLSNSSAIAGRLDGVRRRCLALFQRRAHWHHYEQFGLEEDDLLDALQRLTHVADTYRALEVSPPAASSSAASNSTRSAAVKGSGLGQGGETGRRGGRPR